jgi:trk system potassium uptake protein TrkA
MEKVEFFKDTIANTVSMDITDIHALKTLPLKECDMVIVCIGDDFGSSIKTTALLRKLGVERLYGRESSMIHKTVLNALGVANTINPEYDTAVVFAEKLTMAGVWSIYSISDDVKIAEVSLPEEYIGRSLNEFDKEEFENLHILALKIPDRKQSTPALEKWHSVDINTCDQSIRLEKDMRLVLQGRRKDIVSYLKMK